MKLVIKIQMLMAAILTTIYTNCQQCVNGYIISTCNICAGKGYLIDKKLQRYACRQCCKGLYKKQSVSSGKIKEKCKICKGKKKLKKN